MKRLVALLVLAALAGCADFKLGGFAYIPYGQDGAFSMKPPAAPASAAK